MPIELSELLKSLSEAVGVSGYEGPITDILREQYAPYVDEFVTSPVGSLVMIKRGQPAESGRSRRIMLAAHTDEIGGLVTQVERGFLHFTNVGGLDRRLLLGQEVTVFGRQVYHGVISSRPPHFSDDDRSRYPDLGAYRIDLGLPAEELAANVRVGDVVAMRRQPVALLGDLLAGKAMDDRASVAALYVCLQELSRLQHQWDVYAVATAQEEVGLKGASTSAYQLDPDVAIAIDVTFANAPEVANNHNIELGKGPALTVGANIHPVMAGRLKEIAGRLDMPLQTEYLPAGTGTDAWAIQISRDGIPTALLSIPLRYMHSTIETASLKDIERTGRLMAYFIAELDEAFITELTPTEGLEEE